MLKIVRQMMQCGLSDLDMSSKRSKSPLEMEFPKPASERVILPWLGSLGKSISDDSLELPAITVSSETFSLIKTHTSSPPHITWFCHGALSLGTDTRNKRKMDFGLSWRDCVLTGNKGHGKDRNTQHSRIHWEDVEVVGDHANQQQSAGEKNSNLPNTSDPLFTISLTGDSSLVF